MKRFLSVLLLLCCLCGVASAEVSLEAAEATVVHDPLQVAREALVGAIEDAGFDAT